MFTEFWKTWKEKRHERIALNVVETSQKVSLRRDIKKALRDWDTIEDAIDLGTKGHASLELILAAGDIYDKDRRIAIRSGQTQGEWYTELKRCHPNVPSLQTIKRYIYLSDHRGKVRDGMDQGYVTNIKTALAWIRMYTGTSKKRR